jgi:RNA polymerase sigma-70 factor (ECF subfamily)
MKSDNEIKQQFHLAIAQHKGILYKVARTYCPAADDRQDLIQEMMIQIWKAFPRYDERFKLATWIYRISLNVAISFYRRNIHRQRESIQLIEEHQGIQEEIIEDKQEQLLLLEQFISELNNLDKALTLLYLEDKSYSEISEIMNLSVSNVGTRIGRIKEKLKNKFSQLK